MDFLRAVADHYIAKYSDTNDWSKVCFVFPSHRAGVFFRKTLQEAIGKRVLFGAQIITLDDFIKEKAKSLKDADGNRLRITTADNITLAFELYLAYKEVMGQTDGGVADACDFDRFYSWAPMFLGDFDDADKYMVDVHDLFSNVAAYEGKGDDLSHLDDNQRAVVEAFWGVKFTEVTEHKMDGSGEEEKRYYYERFIETYEKLDELYEAFNKRLTDKGLAYTGKLYRMVAEMYRNKEQDDDDMHYAFIGFNALTEAEKMIFNALRLKKGRADFYWDYPEEIVAPFEIGGREVNIEHGAGRFVRQFKDEYKSPLAPPKREGDRDINIIKYAYPQGQVAHVAQFVKSCWTNEGKMTPRTAIVLTDETMLLPVLSTLPSKSDDGKEMNYPVNVTMGYPMNFSQVYGLLDLLVRLQREVSRSGTSDTFYHKIVVPILQHPWVHRMVEEAADDLLKSITRENKIRIEKSEFEGKGVLEKIFRQVDATEVAQYVQSIFIEVHGAAVNADDSLAAECAYKIVKVATRFAELLDEYMNSNGVKISVGDAGLVMSMLDSLAQRQTVDFHGEPLAGLQIMGILETRAVDFDNLVILDMNEGVFPKKNASMTFIPYVIRKAFGMPTHEFQDGIFSYYFFRLINRAKRVDLLYAESNDASRQGVSRFVQQVKYEYNYKYTEKVAVHQLNINAEREPVITKTEGVKRALVDRFCDKVSLDKNGKRKNYLSPSALANYLDCPVKFYLMNVLRINDTDEVEEEADQRSIGNVFHNTMEELYRNFVRIGGTFDEGIKKKLLSGGVIEKKVKEIFMKELKIKNEIEGRNILYERVVARLVETMIEKENAPFVLLGTENSYETEMNLDDGTIVNIGGKIDREHRVDGVHYVVDYKTGHVGDLKVVQTKDKSFVEYLFDGNDVNHGEIKAILQTMLYCKLLYDTESRQGKTNMMYKCGVIFIKSLLGNKKLEYEAKINEVEIGEDGKKSKKKGEEKELVYNAQIDREMTTKLKEVVEEIFGDAPFKCRDAKRCSNDFSRCAFYDTCYRPQCDGKDA